MQFSKSVEDLIADFRGLPRTVSTASLRDPVELESLLVILKEKYKLEKESPERSLVENWEAIFGSSLAPRCQPLAIRDGRTLVVAVSNQTLRQEMQFRKRLYLGRIRVLPHCSGIRDIRFSTG